MRRNSSVGASSLIKLSLLPPGQPSPATAAAAAALLPPCAASARFAGPTPSPLGPPALPRLHTPSAAALAAAQGIDVSDVSLVQPSPMAAEATVAALSALMRQPARQPSLPHLHQPAKRGGGGGGGSGGAAGGGKKKQLLSFGDELEEGERPGCCWVQPLPASLPACLRPASTGRAQLEHFQPPVPSPGNQAAAVAATAAADEG